MFKRGQVAADVSGQKIPIESDGFVLKTCMPEAQLKKRAAYAARQAEIIIEAFLSIDPDGRMPEPIWALVCCLAVQSLLDELTGS